MPQEISLVAGSAVGGLVGVGFGSGDSIVGRYATGNVTGFSFLGGLSGLYSGAIKNSYATGNGSDCKYL